MTSLIPIIQDLAPLVLPTSIHIAQAPPAPVPGPSSSSDASQHQRKVITQPIISGKSGHLHVFVTHLPPSSATSIRHHGEQDLVIHVLAGTPSFSSLTHGQVIESFLTVGSFVLVPAWTEYRLSNGSEVEEAVFVGTGSGREESVVELDGWGGKAVKS